MSTFEEMVKETRFTVEEDPDNDQLTRVTFHRRRTPRETFRSYEGQRAVYRYLKHAAAMLQGAGLLKLHETESGGMVGVIDMGMLMMLSEDTETDADPS